jgi:TRAP transporter TAXI family solute receptor
MLNDKGGHIMKKRFSTLWLVIILVTVFSSTAFAVDLAIMTGGKKGTYYQFGLNLQKLVISKDFNLSVVNSNGSIENLYAVYKRPRTQMGIVQSDVLAFVSRMQTDPVLKKIAVKTKMIFPLYNEEIHLLGSKDITDFDALEGRRVAIGKEGSGTYLTARLLFEVSGIRPRDMVPIGTTDALSRLKAGNIDAMFYVSGYPVKLFKEDVTEENNLALIPILSKSIVSFYPKAEIPANTYPWQHETLNTVAVKAVLVSFNFRRLNCEYVGKFAQILYENMDWLKKNGHPKWKSVDLDFPLKGWEQYDCVKKYLAKEEQLPKKSIDELNPIVRAVKEIFNQ